MTISEIHLNVRWVKLPPYKPLLNRGGFFIIILYTLRSVLISLGYEDNIQF